MNTIFLYERANEILLYLLNSYTPLTIFEIQNLVMVSNRTVRYDLDTIDGFLLSKNVNKLSRKPGVGIAFHGDEKDRVKIKTLLNGTSSYNYIYSPNERVDMIILMFLGAKDYITTEEIAEELRVSQSTINNDLKSVRDIIANYNLKLSFRQRYGLILEGKESNIRILLVELWLKYVYNSSVVKSNHYKENNQCKSNRIANKLQDGIDIPFVENAVNIMEKKIVSNYSDVSYANIVVHICYP